MKSALLVVDVQKGMCVGPWAVFDIQRVIDRINSVAAAARSAGAPVIFIQHEESAGPLRHDSDEWQLDPRLVVRPEDIRVRKTTPDSFRRTELHEVLQAHGIERLIVCGLQSEMCVDSTVRAALAMGYPVVLVADAHSTLDNGVLSAAQIAAHHNVTLCSIESYGPRVTATPAADVRITA